MTRDEAAIERMALARYQAFFREPPNDCDEIIPWEDLSSSQQHFWLDEERAAFDALLADPPPAVERAVIARLREPSGFAVSRACGVPDCEGDGLRYIANIWRAMIDARLAELDAERENGSS